MSEAKPFGDALDLSAREASSLAAIGAQESRALDRDACLELGIPSLVLMEHAARGAAVVAKQMLGDDGEAFILVLAGGGNNGGDGLALARLLAPRCRVALLAEPDPERSPDAALELEILEHAGLPPSRQPSVEQLGELARDCGLVVDALLGTGLESAPRGLAADWIRWLAAQSLDVLSLDLPSGLDADSGEAYAACVHATATVSFARPKRGLFRGAGPRVCGRVHVASIGLPEPWVRARL